MLSQYLTALNSGENCMQATWEHILKPLLDADLEHQSRVTKLDIDLDQFRTEVAHIVRERDSELAGLAADNEQLRLQVQRLSARLDNMDGSSAAFTDQMLPSAVQPLVPYFGLVSKIF